MKILIAILLIIFLSGTLIHFLRMCKIVKYYQKENEELSKMFNESGEKQIPKKATDKEYVPNGRLVYGRCPICNTFTDNYKAYCNKCGQAIDWSV